MTTILDRITEHKRSVELPRRMHDVPLSVVQAQAAAAPLPRDFIGALRARPGVALIAEVKRASPSRGLLRPDFDPVQLAAVYAAHGAAAISVLTDTHFFQGELAHLAQIRAWFDSRARGLTAGASQILGNAPLDLKSSGSAHRVSALPPLTAAGASPLLCKDFIIHPYQVYEARAAGADAVLLIAALVGDREMANLLAVVHQLGMAALVEVHTSDELARVLPLRPGLIGVNNRDLRDFSVNLDRCLSLRRRVPPEICFVAESGIHTPADVARLRAAGVDAMLVGEALVVAPDVAGKVRELVYGES
jgi:indole-3-glycerol phosphate synthase